MGSAEVSVETSKKYCKVDKHEHIARSILHDCLDRRGIKNAFADCDNETIDDDIIATWIEIIKLCEKEHERKAND